MFVFRNCSFFTENKLSKVLASVLCRIAFLFIDPGVKVNGPNIVGLTWYKSYYPYHTYVKWRANFSSFSRTVPRHTSASASVKRAINGSAKRKEITYRTRKLCYRKDYRTMRLILTAQSDNTHMVCCFYFLIYLYCNMYV